VTCDGRPAAHFEDTFVIRREGAEPLTRLPKSSGV
jgi:methionine aminopeptidase